MALCTAADIIRIGPEFVDVAIPTIDLFIDMAEAQINESIWGNKSKFGCMYLTMHLLTINGFGVTGEGNISGNDGAAVTLEMVGQVQVQYGQSSIQGLLAGTPDAFLGGTRYGIEYARLKKSLAAGAMVL